MARIWRPGAAAVAAASLLSAASSAASAVVWVKAGAGAPTMEGDYQDCTDEAHLIGVQLNMSRTTVTAPGGVLIGAVVGAGFSAALSPKAHSDYIKTCMEGRGYGGLALTGAEEADYGSQKTPEARNGWLQAFYATPDFAGRRDAVLAKLAGPPPSKPVPPAPSEPFTFGAIKMDPATLTVASGEVDGVRAVVSGPITHRTTGRVTKADGFSGWGVKTGLVVQKSVVSGPDGINQTYWCGQVSKAWPDGINDHCLWAGPGGVSIYPGRDTPWLDRPAFSDQPSRQTSASFAVEESPDDLIGPMEFGLYVEKVTTSYVRLVAEAKWNNKYVDFWAADLPFDDQGKAVLPFWSHRLTVTRAGSGVAAAFTKDGDGAGWEVVRDTSTR
jgi:hypothetical protein